MSVCCTVSPSLPPPLSARPTQSFPVAAAVGPSYTVLPCRRRCSPVLHSPSLPLSARPTHSFPAAAAAVGPSYTVLPCRRRRCRPVLHSPWRRVFQFLGPDVPVTQYRALAEFNSYTYFERVCPGSVPRPYCYSAEHNTRESTSLTLNPMYLLVIL